LHRTTQAARSGLRVSDTEIGRIGMLICGENANPRARYALMADGEQVHICSYPRHHGGLDEAAPPHLVV
jgi:hypothetical protein